MDEPRISSRNRRASQADIANQLGVSISTVSRALANEVGISEVVRRDVRRVAQELGYRSKHGIAAAVADRRAVALVPLGGAMGGLANFYFDIVEGMRNEAAAQGMALDIRLVNEDAVSLDMIRRQLSVTHAGGLLMTGVDPSSELAEWCLASDVPVVLVNGVDPAMRFSSVAPANFHGAYLGTKTLLDAGHRKILHFTYRNRPTILQRRRGYEAAMADRPDAVPTIVNSNDCTAPQLIADILAGVHDVTAVFCWNDVAAIQIMEGLFGSGGPLPPHFSIIGFDGLPAAGITTPRLSTVHVDRQAIGRSAIRVMLQHLDGERAVQQVEVGLSLTRGETIFPL